MKTSSYRIKITTRGFVHIGNGNKYGSKDYFLNNGKIAILDAPHFVAQLTQEQLQAYCEFLENSKSDRGLHEFLEEFKLLDVAIKTIAYQVDTKLSRTKRGTIKYLDVFEFIKDAYGCPYIPGSSFKGMLRTVLLTEIIATSEHSFLKEYPQGSDWHKDKEAAKRIEKKALFLEQPDPANPATLNDVMRFISVSDSKPLSANDLVFVQKYDRFSKNDDASHKRQMGNQSIGKTQDGNELNIYRECLKPGTTIELKLNIDERIQTFLSLNVERLAGAFELFTARYEECFLDHFNNLEKKDASPNAASNADGRCEYVGSSNLRCRNRAVEGSRYCNLHKSEATASKDDSAAGLTCYLGGGVDYNSKTLMNALFANDGERLSRISHLLSEQFPTRIAAGEHIPLRKSIENAGFPIKNMRQKGKQKKEDHRHWKDQYLGVSPHTLKLGKVGNDLLPMGKCELSIERID